MYHLSTLGFHVICKKSSLRFCKNIYEWQDDYLSFTRHFRLAPYLTKTVPEGGTKPNAA